jgi:hypothetical protein
LFSKIYRTIVFTYKIINKTNADFNAIRFKLVGIKGKLRVVGKHPFKVPKQGMNEGTLFIEINQNVLEHDKTKLEIDVYEGNKKIQTTHSSFLSPQSFD